MKYKNSKNEPTYNKDDLLDLLEAGKAFHDAGMWADSQTAFDLAEQKMMWKEDTINTPEGYVTQSCSCLVH